MNKVRIWWRWLLLSALFSGLVWGHEIGRPAKVVASALAQEGAISGDYVPGEILVGLKPGVVSASVLFADMEARMVKSLPPCAISGSGIGYRMAVPSGREQEAINKLKQDEAILFAEPNWLVHAADLDDASALAQPETPYLVDDPSYIDKQWYLQRIGASRAWGLAFGADGFRGELTTIQVAVVDSGIDVDHPEFEGILLPGANYATSDAEPVDRFGHGTHVSGLIGAIVNNGIGIAGIAPKIKLDPRKVLNNSGSGTIADVAQGICEAADAGANLINLSLETPQFSDTLQDAVRYATNKGILLIAASGNSGHSDVAYPAAFAEVMAVGSTTFNDVRATYSNYEDSAQTIALVAPGGASPNSIYSTWAKGAWCRDDRAPLADSGYCTSDGTSMAAAVVTGAAALLLSINCDLTPAQLRELLTSTAAPIAGSPNEVGSGRLDLQAAVRKLLPSDLRVSHRSVLYETNQSGQPYTTTLRLDNPSGDLIDWETVLLETPSWVHLVGADTDGQLTGDTSYGRPSHVTFLIEASNETPGIWRATAQIVGTRTDTTEVIREVGIDLLIGTLSPQAYLPLVVQQPGGGGTIPPPLSTWETPAKPADRSDIPLMDEDSVTVALPFAFALQSSTYNEVHVNANGFVSFDTAPVSSNQNHCLPNLDAIGTAIYGWWADLDPSLADAQVSTFRSGSDRFVIEYANVPSAVDGSEYVVNFQIVLYRNGDIRLNYGQVPDLQFQPPPVTVGVEENKGLLYNQIACKDDDTELGILPNANQSIHLKAKESTY